MRLCIKALCVALSAALCAAACTVLAFADSGDDGSGSDGKNSDDGHYEVVFQGMDIGCEHTCENVFAHIPLLSAGDVYFGELDIVNASDESVQLTIYIGDWAAYEDGSAARLLDTLTLTMAHETDVFYNGDVRGHELVSGYSIGEIEPQSWETISFSLAAPESIDAELDGLENAIKWEIDFSMDLEESAEKASDAELAGIDALAQASLQTLAQTGDVAPYMVALMIGLAGVCVLCIFGYKIVVSSKSKSTKDEACDE